MTVLDQTLVVVVVEEICRHYETNTKKNNRLLTPNA